LVCFWAFLGIDKGSTKTPQIATNHKNMSYRNPRRKVFAKKNGKTIHNPKPILLSRFWALFGEGNLQTPQNKYRGNIFGPRSQFFGL
jgi:hypothetical protein